MAEEKYKSNAIRMETQLRGRRLLKSSSNAGMYFSDQEASDKWVKASNDWYSYISTLDSDDRMKNQYLKNMYEDLKNARKLAHTKKEKEKIDSIISLRKSQLQQREPQTRDSLEERTAELFQATSQRAYGYLAILSFAGALLAVSLKLTGSVVGPASASNKWIGLCLSLVGCMFTFFYFKAKRK